MKALVWNTSSGDVQYKEDYPKPKAGPNEVLIRVAYCGISGTDVKNLKETCQHDHKMVVIGHEISGTIESVGSEAIQKRLPVNSRVFVNSYPYCKVCTFCLSGQVNFCTTVKHDKNGLGNAIGAGKDGGLAEYVCVDADTVYRLPDDLPTLEACMCEPLSCIAHGLECLGTEPVKAGKRVLIFGAGVKGLLWAVTLHHKGIRRITICEMDEERRNAVEEMNFNFRLVDPDYLNSLEEPEYDTIIDCSGCETALSIATRIAKPKASICIFGSSHVTTGSTVFPMDIVMKELRIFGCLNNPFTSPDGLILTDDLFSAGHLNFDELNIKIYSLSAYADGINILRNKKVTKVVFDLN